MSMSRKNKAIIWLLIFILLIVLFTSIATYAYFQARELKQGSFNVDVTSKGVDTLKFKASDDAVFEANANNFSRGKGHDVYGEAFVSTILDTTKASAEYCYNVSVILPDEAVFTYSKPGTPELVLDVAKSTDNENYTNVISNMDITTKTGVINIPTTAGGSDYKHVISATKNVTSSVYWKAKVTLKWFNDTDQVINDYKAYKATIKANIVEC